jgi:hypothetical protein
MNQEIKDKWVQALRSGDYEQGTGCLHKGDTFCCLGVLCDLYATEKGIKWESENYGIYTFLGDQTLLPLQVAHWAGLDDEDPFVYGETLTTWNDGFADMESRTFAEIADLIKKYL